jgi:hypothetical protein
MLFQKTVVYVFLMMFIYSMDISEANPVKDS